MLNHKIRYNIKFQNYDQKLLAHNLLTSLFDLKKNLNFVRKTSVSYMPSKVKYYCVLRSPFVDNISKEHYELRIFNTLITLDIVDPKNVILERIYDKFLNKIFSMPESAVILKKFKIKY